MIGDKQKRLLHIYAHAGAIEDPTYRNILRGLAGVSSAADPEMNQQGFESCMAALEKMLFMRVDKRQVDDPIGRSRYIFTRDYWQRRQAKDGRCNRRHVYAIRSLFTRLCEFLPEEQCTDAYLQGIVSHSIGRNTDLPDLNVDAAGMVIVALKDRIAYAEKNVCQGVPF